MPGRDLTAINDFIPHCQQSPVSHWPVNLVIHLLLNSVMFSPKIVLNGSHSKSPLIWGGFWFPLRAEDKFMPSHETCLLVPSWAHREGAGAYPISRWAKAGMDESPVSCGALWSIEGVRCLAQVYIGSALKVYPPLLSPIPYSRGVKLKARFRSWAEQEKHVLNFYYMKCFLNIHEH